MTVSVKDKISIILGIFIVAGMLYYTYGYDGELEGFYAIKDTITDTSGNISTYAVDTSGNYSNIYYNATTGATSTLSPSTTTATSSTSSSVASTTAKTVFNF